VDAHERLRTLDRSSVATSSLWSTLFGHDTIGFSGAGRLEPGALADMVGIDLEEPGIAGADPYEVLRVGTRASIAKVWVGGELVVTDAARERRALGVQLRSMIETLWRQQ
jgi:cytosine/adenosine deaminase-related metal-dependent hydrolase